MAETIILKSCYITSNEMYFQKKKKKKGLLTIWYRVSGLLNVDAKYISA